MATTFSARQVCEMALQRVGAYSPADAGADGILLSRTLSWLDVVMSQTFGTQRIFFLVPATLTLSLTDDKISYDLLDDLGSSAPDLGVQFPITATLLKGDSRTPLDIITREQYEGLTDKTLSGTPDKVFIDRLSSPTLYTHPTLADATSYTIELVVQTYAPAFHDTSGEIATQLREAWQLWAILATAYEIGSGPVRVLENNRLERIKDDRDDARRELMAFENRQHATTSLRAGGSGRVAAKDF